MLSFHLTSHFWKHSLLWQLERQPPQSQGRFLDPDNLHFRFRTSNLFRPFFVVTDLWNFQTQGAFTAKNLFFWTVSGKWFWGNLLGQWLEVIPATLPRWHQGTVLRRQCRQKLMHAPGSTLCSAGLFSVRWSDTPTSLDGENQTELILYLAFTEL